MSGINKQTQDELHKTIDAAIKSSERIEVASAGEIAEKLGVEKTLVARRFSVLGFVWNGRRWIWRHNPPKAEE